MFSYDFVLLNGINIRDKLKMKSRGRSTKIELSFPFLFSFYASFQRVSSALVGRTSQFAFRKMRKQNTSVEAAHQVLIRS